MCHGEYLKRHQEDQKVIPLTSGSILLEMRGGELASYSNGVWLGGEEGRKRSGWNPIRLGSAE